jgi:predicted PolB exonuclease-like 3'-5' exonuclease
MIKKEMGENGFVCVPSPGFDEYYIVCRSNYSEVKKSTFKNEKKKLLEDFKSSQANKLNSKLIASRFCKKISAQAWAG